MEKDETCRFHRTEKMTRRIAFVPFPILASFSLPCVSRPLLCIYPFHYSLFFLLLPLFPLYRDVSECILPSLLPLSSLSSTSSFPLSLDVPLHPPPSSVLLSLSISILPSHLLNVHPFASSHFVQSLSLSLITLSPLLCTMHLPVSSPLDADNILPSYLVKIIRDNYLDIAMNTQPGYTAKGKNLGTKGYVKIMPLYQNSEHINDIPRGHTS